MASALGELELEGLGEFETEFETELEQELEQEFETELEQELEYEFEQEGEIVNAATAAWNDVSNWARNQWTAVKSPDTWQHKAVQLTDRAILAGAPAIGTGVGAYLGGDKGAKVGGAIGTGVQKVGTALIPPEWRESEFETEFETELETESELGPVSRVYSDAMMEHLGHAAMESESEFEAAENFLPLVPMVASKLLPLAAKAAPHVAAKVMPRVAHTINRVTPHLTRGVGNLARTLHRHPQTRPLLRVVPSIARRAVTTIARHAAAGRPVSPRHAVRILAHQNHRVLSDPRIVRGVLRRSHAMDGRYHRAAGLPAAGRHYRWRWRNGLVRPGMPGVTGAYSVGRWRPGAPGYGVRRVHPGVAARLGARPCPSCGVTTVRTGGGCKVVVVK